MRRQRPTPCDERARVLRLAWLASFLTTLALIATLATAGSAQALTVPSVPIPTPAAFAPQDEEDEAEAEAEAEEGEGDEAGYEACEEDEEGYEVCDVEAEEEIAEAPRECLLSSARATVFATPGRDRVRLQVRYTTTSPTAVAVEYGLHGAKGSLYLGGDRKRFGPKGVLSLSKRLSAAQMAKVLAAKDFTVRLHALAAPGYCKPFFDHHLDVRRATPSGLAWSQSE